MASNVRRQARYVAVLMGVATGALLLTQNAWAEKGADHAAVPRYPGTEISNYDFKEFEEAQLLLSMPVERNGKYVVDKVLPIEGQVTYIHYKMPSTLSALQVFRNYQSSLKRSGFVDLFVCNRPCTTANLSVFKPLMKARDLYLNYSNDNQYLAAQRGNTYVSLWVNAGGAWLFVIDKQALDENQIAVTGESNIAKTLRADGKVDLYGFQFDTGKAVLREGSKPVLGELATVLTENPNMRIEIIGHTDNVGASDANQRLSEQRARAVAEALVASAGIDIARMVTAGAGATRPLEPNTSEAGRAKNRRVEIVAQVPQEPVAASPVPASPAQQNVPFKFDNEEPASRRTQPAAVAPPVPPAAPVQNSADSRNLIDGTNKAIDAANKLKNLFRF